MSLDPISAGIDFVTKIADKIWPDPSAKADALFKLEQLKQSGELAQLTANTDLFRAEVDDRNSARQREVAVKDSMPAVLGCGVTIGFFGVLGYLLGYGAPEKGGEALFIMLGSLGTAWTGVMGYYFGSTASSRSKNDLIAQLRK